MYYYLNVAKYNLSKVNLKPMVLVISPLFACGLWGICRDWLHVVWHSSDSCRSVLLFCKSLQIHYPHFPFGKGNLFYKVSIRSDKYFHWTNFSVTVPVSGCRCGGSHLWGCHGFHPVVPGLPQAFPC